MIPLVRQTPYEYRATHYDEQAHADDEYLEQPHALRQPETRMNAPPTGVRGNMSEAEALHTMTVSAPQAGARLDRWLADALPALSRSRLKALIIESQVRIGG